MKARVKWVEQVAFLGETESNHAILHGRRTRLRWGRNLGPRPMELLLLGAGGCTSFDVMTILKKSRQDVTDCYVELDQNFQTHHVQKRDHHCCFPCHYHHCHHQHHWNHLVVS